MSTQPAGSSEDPPSRDRGSARATWANAAIVTAGVPCPIARSCDRPPNAIEQVSGRDSVMRDTAAGDGPASTPREREGFILAGIAGRALESVQRAPRVETRHHSLHC